MNLRHTIQVNKPLEKNNNYKIIDFYGESDFNNWIGTSNHHLISIDYLLDMVMKNNTNQIESVMHSNDNGNDSYSYRIKVLYQER